MSIKRLIQLSLFGAFVGVAILIVSVPVMRMFRSRDGPSDQAPFLSERASPRKKGHSSVAGRKDVRELLIKNVGLVAGKLEYDYNLSAHYALGSPSFKGARVAGPIEIPAEPLVAPPEPSLEARTGPPGARPKTDWSLRPPTPNADRAGNFVPKTQKIVPVDRATLKRRRARSAQRLGDLNSRVSVPIVDEPAGRRREPTALLLAGIGLAVLSLSMGVRGLLRARVAPRKLPGLLPPAASATPASRGPLRPQPGDVFGGIYHFVRPLDPEGSGFRFLVSDRRTQRHFVVKPFRAGGAAMSDGERDAVRARMATAYGINYPGIVRVIELLEEMVPPMIVQEHVEFKNLAAFLAGRPKLSWAWVIAVTDPICETLAYGHERGVLHLNLKPSNIFLDEAGEVRLADFRLSGGLPEAGDHPDPFVAPELYKGLATPRSDIYSLGACIREVLRSGDLETPEAEEVLRTALAEEPLRRYKTIGEFREAMEAIR